MGRKIVLIPGDGIGPEITDTVKKVVDATGLEIDWDIHHIGLQALSLGKDILPPETLDAIREYGVALKGPCTTPIGEGFSSVNVGLRKELDLYAAVRPVRNIEGVPSRFENVNLVIVRENTEGLYSGVENTVSPGVVMSMKVATEKACKRIAKWAFEYCIKRGRKKITVFHKANIMKVTDGLFISKSRELSKNYKDIKYEEFIIDAGCMKLVQDPSQFDVLLLENLYGDVISDLCAGLVGGLGVVPGANIGDDVAVFEAVHGSAPDIAGKDIANPLAFVMSAVMMFNHIADKEDKKEFRETADKIKEAYNEALSHDIKTRDLGGTYSTSEFTKELVKLIK
ncbi:MAG: NAD-dependent isocitrate dehydrogenase [Candidatus Dadabacteria bacterium]|nr:NAD-dependent isocitrate dehydrogenase [Candidatus Dadabacteria bacterium]NIQ14213.1 NAD-dependent isocitrate dehydrogenase [Candidatus Dadabacteria bacterium]